MKILGIAGGMHSCGLAYLKDGKPIFAFEEERFNRIRNYKDFYQNLFRYPFQSGQNVWFDKDWDWNDLDYITSHFSIKETEEIWDGVGLGPFPKEKFIQTNHHRAHCSLAYYCSGFKEDTLVVSIDAMGEKYSARYFIGSNGNMEDIGNISSDFKSLGHYYAMLTEFLGFKRLKDEGKVVGMASHGYFHQDFYDVFNKCIKVKDIKTDRDYGKIISGGVYEDFYKLWFEKFGSKSTSAMKNAIAYNGQLVFEEKIIQIFNNLHKTHPHLKKVALAGGIFANVKLNKRINELEWVDEVFIAPPMGDEGIPLGSALSVHKLKNPDFKPFRLNDVYLGTSYGEKNTKVIGEWCAYGEVKDNNKKYHIRPYNEQNLAYDLKEGKIVGWFQGRHEHGPRALCNRSIIADPSVPGMYKKINDKLQRNDFMPFAPVVLDNHVNNVFDVKKSKYTAEFMTMLYDTKEEWHDKIPAVIHPVDKTARIQIVTAKSNPKFYRLINKFWLTTSIPVLLNTSFNIHGEPIVCRPEEAFVHLDNNIVDILVINNKVYTKK
jgi:carbamoyltransferase